MTKAACFAAYVSKDKLRPSTIKCVLQAAALPLSLRPVWIGPQCFVCFSVCSPSLLPPFRRLRGQTLSGSSPTILDRNSAVTVIRMWRHRTSIDWLPADADTVTRFRPPLFVLRRAQRSLPGVIRPGSGTSLIPSEHAMKTRGRVCRGRRRR